MILALVVLCASQAGLPDAQCTPGAVDATATLKAVCTPGHAGKKRHVTQAQKNAAYAAYGIAHHKPGAFEVDHLVSLELGGSNDQANLWPQSYSGRNNAHDKDRLENRLHALVCKGQVPLAEAQRAIAIDWIAALKKYGGSAGPR